MIKKYKLIDRTVAIIVGFFSSYIFITDQYDIYFQTTYLSGIHLWNYKAFVFCFGLSFSIVGFVYGFRSIFHVLISLFSDVDKLKSNELNKNIDLIGFLIRISSGVARIGMIFAFLNLMNKIYTGRDIALKFAFLFEVLVVYLYMLCAIYILYCPAKRLLINKLEKKENA